jgi:hypothetical protein
VALQFGGGGQQGPDLAVAQAQVALAAGDAGLQQDPALGHAIGLRWCLIGIQAQLYRSQLRHLRLQHGADLLAAFQGLDVPGEGDQVAPVAILLEQGGGLAALPSRRAACRVSSVWAMDWLGVSSGMTSLLYLDNRSRGWMGVAVL